MRPIIRVERISKQFRIGRAAEPYFTLREAIVRLAKAPFGGGKGGASEEAVIRALDDVSFEVTPGEVVGIVGRNGGGKSTLLKILSRITWPTAGEVRLHGRVGSLLEVGTGFHPELTGRENIFLNGAILGMRQAEIRAKFEEMVAFAEIERFLDTPVKHYSSGMYVRLAFAVAAHLDPEILLVDEVLAVGDASFQKKCLGKMGEVARSGRTVLFVSHNMTAVNQLCTRALHLEEGRLLRSGPVAEVVTAYLRDAERTHGERVWPDPAGAPGSRRARLHAVRCSSAGRVGTRFDIDKPIEIEIEFWNLLEGSRRVCPHIYLLDAMGNIVLSSMAVPRANSREERWFDRPHPVGLFRATCTLPGDFLNEGRYFVTAFVVTFDPLTVEARVPEVLGFEVFDTGSMRDPGISGGWHGAVRVRLAWETHLVGAEGPAPAPLGSKAE